MYAGMVGALDEAVANISTALQAAAMLPSSLLLFTTDNGGECSTAHEKLPVELTELALVWHRVAAPFKHLGGATMSNWPLRGGKAELWEGGVKGACFLYGGALWAHASSRRPLGA